MEFVTEITRWLTWISWIIGIAIYVYLAFCLQTIARKTNTEKGWLAWIPIANVYLMCKIAGKPGWWLVFFFIPIANVVFGVIVWMGIAEARDKNKWLGILMIVPIANLVVPGYLAFFGGGTEAIGAETQANLLMPAYLAYAKGGMKARGAEAQANFTMPGYMAYAGGATKIREMEIQTKKETKEAQRAISDIGSTVYGKKARLVLPLLTGFKQIAQFKEHLGKVEDLTIVMTGGSVDEGSIIVVSVQESMDLIHVLNEMPVVEDASKKGENIAVKLKTLSTSEEGEPT